MRFVSIAIAAVIAALMSVKPIPAGPLTPQKPIVIPGGAGAFDWMRVDARSHRLFATHKGTKTLAVIDLTTDTALPSPVVGTPQGIAVDRRDNKIFLGLEAEHKLVVLDYATLKQTGEIAVSGPVDDVLYCSKNQLIYADHDDGPEVWVIDPKTEKIVSTITIPEAPEKLEYDGNSGRIYQNIKSNNTVQVIDPETNKVEKSIDTSPATGPHGLAIDSKSQRLYSAGSNGKLVVIDIKTGKVIDSQDIEKGVDQIAFDSGNSRIYCACKGAICVLEATDSGAKPLGRIPTHSGSHTIAVDPATHAVWTCYFDKTDSYLLKLIP